MAYRSLVGMLAALPVLMFNSIAPAVECPLLKAVYAPVDAHDDMSAPAGGQNTYRIRHRSGKREHSDSAYVLHMSEERQKIHYNFGFSHLDGYGGIALVFLGSGLTRSVYRMKASDPQSRIYYFAADMSALIPDRENPGAAPPYLMMPELGNSFWYWTTGKRKFVPPPGMWKIISCGE